MRWLPIGSGEPHGGHLPDDTDTLIATHLAQACAGATDTMLPAIPYGCSFEHRRLGHGVSLSVTTFATLVRDVVETSPDPLARIINGHGGNHVLSSLVQELNAHGSRVLLLPTREHWDQANEVAGWTFRMHDDMHAGAMERSLLLVWGPERVSDRILSDLTAPHRPLFSAEGMRRYATGHSGFPNQATGEAGQRAIQSLIDAVTGTVSSWVNE